jgi:predicted GIY-YIG superfamily endonuclease
MFYVYILQSIDFPDKFYIGYTKDLRRRLKQHNYEHFGHTDKYRPWRIKDYFAIDDEQKAKDFEKFLKSQCGREFIKKHF